MPTTTLPGDPVVLLRHLRGWAREAGFDDVGVTTKPLSDDMQRLRSWLDAGHHGQMAWMSDHAEMREYPSRLHPGTVSVIAARMNCHPDAAAAETVLADGTRAYIARYALGRDYHKLLRSRLQRLAARLAETLAPHGYRVLTDSAPALEKALARDAGLGWIGKHTLLLNRDAGSWFLLGEIYTDLPLPDTAAKPPRNHCGSCSACIDICPTQAITAPGQLDARRCIAYLTIEHRGSIPVELRPAIGNRIFGCDDCQLVCPWNRYATPSREADFAPRHGLDAPSLAALFAWDEAEWLRRTEGMALRRASYHGWLRNLAVAMGNAPPDASIDAALAARADHADAVVREHVHWALQRRQDAARGVPATSSEGSTGSDRIARSRP